MYYNGEEEGPKGKRKRKGRKGKERVTNRRKEQRLMLILRLARDDNSSEIEPDKPKEDVTSSWLYETPRVSPNISLAALQAQTSRIDPNHNHAWLDSRHGHIACLPTHRPSRPTDRDNCETAGSFPCHISKWVYH